MAVNKVYRDAHEALTGLLHDGMTILAGGFGLCGIRPPCWKRSAIPG